MGYFGAVRGMFIGKITIRTRFIRESMRCVTGHARGTQKSSSITRGKWHITYEHLGRNSVIGGNGRALKQPGISLMTRSANGSHVLVPV